MIYIQSGYSPDPDLNHARILYASHAAGLTPTASTSATGHPAIAATYPTTFEYWEPTALPATWALDLASAKAVDAVGLYGDLAGCTCAVEYSANGTTWTVAMTQALTDKINMLLFASVSARYWRLQFTVAIPRLAVAYIGTALAMQRKIYQGHTPLTLARVTDIATNMSERGQFLGRSIIRMGAQTSCEWAHLKAAWYRSNFDPFVSAARTDPFFIGWRPLQYPSEMGFVWATDDIKPKITGPRDFMSVGLTVRGLINGA